ncbi:MAG: FAD-binding oxidoreductase [Dehalococcoidia bacterium]|nr:FAD-binding oxidoreductase [Dehalococcoidia bacterium]
MRKSHVALFGMLAAGVAMLPGLRKKSLHPGGPPAARSWRMRITSHETFSHDSIDSLGYDWSRIADPAMAPKFPLKVYLPQSTGDIVKIVQEAKTLGEKLAVRSKGHSSNDLVLTEGGSVVVTEKLNRIVAVDRERMTATVQSGAISAEVDDYLATMGLGLPIIGDHNHITVGGFASVGGISPASHRFGLFIDNIESFEYVNWDGDVLNCSRTENAADFWRVLAGTGQHGIMSTLTLKLIEIDKYGTILENEQTRCTNVDDFVAVSSSYINDPGDALYERGVWIDFQLPRRRLTVGQFSAYKATPASRLATLRGRLAYGYLHRIGYLAGRLPPGLDRTVKYIGTAGVIFSPKYATIKNIEFFTDKILDSTVGDPTRMLIVLAPLERYEELFRESFALMVDYRERTGCFTFVSVYVKSINSEYLSQGTDRTRFCELMFYMGINQKRMTPEVLDEVVSDFDDLCIRHGGFRYMHSKTVTDARRDILDPNVHYRK